MEYCLRKLVLINLCISTLKIWSQLRRIHVESQLGSYSQKSFIDRNYMLLAVDFSANLPMQPVDIQKARIWGNFTFVQSRRH